MLALFALSGLLVAGLTFGFLDGDDAETVPQGDDTPDDPQGEAGDSGAYHHNLTDGDDVYQGDYSKEYILAGDGDDQVFGDTCPDTLVGEAGNDSLYGQAGKDVLYGMSGDDSLDGGEWNDKLSGGDGGDYLTGGLGKDVLMGDDGNDELHGDEWDDTLDGGSGDDTLDGGKGHDHLDGGDGNDDLSGGAGHDVILGAMTAGSYSEETGEHVIMPSDGNGDIDQGQDTLSGGKGNDVIVLGQSDIALGEHGDGTDAYVMEVPKDGNNTAVIEGFASGADTLSVLYDNQQDAPLDISVTESDGKDALVTVNGQPLVIVKDGAGSFSVSDIRVESEIRA